MRGVAPDDVINRGQDRGGHRTDRPLWPAPAAQAIELRPVVAFARSHNAPGTALRRPPDVRRRRTGPCRCRSPPGCWSRPAGSPRVFWGSPTACERSQLDLPRERLRGRCESESETGMGPGLVLAAHEFNSRLSPRDPAARSIAARHGNDIQSAFSLQPRLSEPPPTATKRDLGHRHK